MTQSESHSFEAPVVDPRAHRSLEELKDGMASLAPPPAHSGRVVALVARGEGGERSTASSATLSPESGIPGDRWARQRSQGESTLGVEQYLDIQIATMEAPIAELIANGQPLTLFGDNLLVEFDLSAENLPTGSRLRIGGAMLEVTPFPHNGCEKFRQRFGSDALRFVSDKSRRDRNLRGIYLRVVDPGQVSVGDKIEVISRS
jgi:MOSC domain-containing protein YiiM